MNKILKFEEIKHCEMCDESVISHEIMGHRLNKSQGRNPKNNIGVSVTVCRCSRCKLIYSNPMPLPMSIQDHYGVPAEDYWQPEYFKISKDYFSGEIESIQEFFEIKKGMSSLDIGSGLGKCMIALDQAGFSAFGIEPSETFYQKAISKMNINPNMLELSMIEDVEYPENMFDFITIGAVFEHLYHPANTLEKALKWLKPSGIIHIEVPSSNHFLAKVINVYNRLRGSNFVTNLSPMHSPFHLYEFSFDSFEQLGKKLDFTIVKKEQYVGPIYFFPKFLHKGLRWYMHKTKTGMQFTIYIKKNTNAK